MNEPIREKTKALVVLSGGQDSTTCLAWARNRFDEVHALTINYGQRHAIEIAGAKMVGILGQLDSHEILTLPAGILEGTSPLTDPNQPVPQYTSQDEVPDSVAKTFVPLRNQFFLTLAANRAFVLGCTHLVTGVCQTDYSGYPDCRQEFVDSLAETINKGTFTGEDWLLGELTIHTPLMNLTKAESVDLAIAEGAYGMLAYSHTAYDGSYPPAGTDAASLLRAKGFEEADIPDPLILRAWINGLTDLPETKNYSKVSVDKALSDLTAELGEDWAIKDQKGSVV